MKKVRWNNQLSQIIKSTSHTSCQNISLYCHVDIHHFLAKITFTKTADLNDLLSYCTSSNRNLNDVSELSNLNFLPCHQVLGHIWSPKLNDWACDNVLSGQAYHAHHGMVQQEHTAVMEWWLARKHWRNSDKTSSGTLSSINLPWSHLGLNLEFY